MDSTTTGTILMPTASTVGPLISVGVILVFCACTLGCILIICVCAKKVCCQARENQPRDQDCERARTPLLTNPEEFNNGPKEDNVIASIPEAPPPYSRADLYPNVDEQIRSPVSQMPAANNMNNGVSQVAAANNDHPPPYTTHQTTTTTV